MRKIQKEIKQSQAHLIRYRYNIKYLTNFTGTNGSALLTKNKAFFLTDPRYTNLAKKVIPPSFELVIIKDFKEDFGKLIKKLKISTIFFEENHTTVGQHKKLKKSLPKIKLKPSVDFIENFRISKKEEEIRIIKKTQRINEKTFKIAIKHLKSGKTEKQIAWEIQKIAHEQGADKLAFSPIVAFGSNSGTPHHKSTNKKLKKGDIVLIDMGTKYKEYCTDMTRVLFTKIPTPKQENIYKTVLNAQETTIKEVKAGMTGAKIDSIARKIIEKAGFKENFTHSLGHGVGLEIHEAPHITPKNKKPIPEYSIITIEPGVYLEKSFGIRIEDMVLVRGKKAENLTRLTKKIEDLILSK